ncbi:hypothetical protein QBC47DRAFT_378909 [Echria macrotheca]|uniref:Uncharacterized protein n=1 Tax=Echria macrotheca TaxID=438768 RepID=A0AAJ0BD27_9PEZI|nr:hypothetical protein QBC47DRAFT_378909 [Echria macrotheca]
MVDAPPGSPAQHLTSPSLLPIEPTSGGGERGRPLVSYLAWPIPLQHCAVHPSSPYHGDCWMPTLVVSSRGCYSSTWQACLGRRRDRSPLPSPTTSISFTAAAAGCVPELAHQARCRRKKAIVDLPPECRAEPRNGTVLTEERLIPMQSADKKGAQEQSAGGLLTDSSSLSSSVGGSSSLTAVQTRWKRWGVHDVGRQPQSATRGQALGSCLGDSILAQFCAGETVRRVSEELALTRAEISAPVVQPPHS